MIYFNNDIKKINYQGYDITKVYACGGELVWNASKPLKFSASYSDGTSYSEECDGDSTLTTATTRAHTTPRSPMTSVTIGECITIIGQHAFSRCSGLTSMDIPSGVTEIGGQAFQYCTSLTSVTIPSGVTKVGDQAFHTDSGLTSITVLAPTPPSLGSSAFYGSTCPIYVPCKSVDSYKSSWYTYASRIEAIPYSCSKLVYTADGNTYSIDCDDTTVLGANYEVSINISNNGTRVSAVTDCVIGTCVESIYPNTFNRFTNLSSVTLTDNVSTIGNGVFYQCYNLSNINLPQSVTTIGGSAFESCYNISAVTVPSGVTTIEAETFIDCNRLKTIILPSTITSIGQFAFSIEDTQDATERAAKLDTLRNRAVYIYATTPPTLSHADVFESAIPNVLATYPIYVPAQSVEAYRTAEHWKDLNDVTRIQAMP